MLSYQTTNFQSVGTNADRSEPRLESKYMAIVPTTEGAIIDAQNQPEEDMNVATEKLPLEQSFVPSSNVAPEQGITSILQQIAASH